MCDATMGSLSCERSEQHDSGHVYYSSTGSWTESGE